jgi:VWFA-related protein
MTAILIAGPAFATSGAAQEPRLIPVQTSMVFVQVVVTDARGRPVRNLVAGDFVAYDDSRAAPVTVFEAPGQAPVSSPVAAPGEPTPEVAPSAAGAPLVTLVAYVDGWNLTPVERSRVLPGFAAFLSEQLTRGGARALVVSAHLQTRVLSALTSDPKQIVAALEATEREPTHAQITRSDARQAIEDVRAMLEGGLIGCEDLTLLQSRIRLQARARGSELEATIARLLGVIEALGTLPGPKALFYLSSGLEQRPAIDLFEQIGDICPSARQKDFSTLVAPMQEYDLAPALRALAARANAARVVLYPVDASGLGGYSVADPSQGGRQFVPSPTTDRMRTENLKSGQWILAEETGGTPVWGTNDVRQPLAKLADEMRSAYVLGWTPDHEPDGRVHRLRIELRRKGLRIRHTPSYFHGERPERGVSRTLAALLVGLEEDGLGVGLSIDAASVTAGDAGRTAKLTVRVPLARLSAVAGSSPAQGRVRVVIATWRSGEESRQRPLEVREKRIDLPLEGAAQGGGRGEFAVDVPLGYGHDEIAVAVEDAVSGLASYRRVRVSTPAVPPGTP